MVKCIFDHCFNVFLIFVAGRRTRLRTTFSSEQMSKLEKRFNQCNYLPRPTRLAVAKQLELNERIIKIWFQNRRMKEKKGQQKNKVITPDLERQERLDEKLLQQLAPNGEGRVEAIALLRCFAKPTVVKLSREEWLEMIEDVTDILKIEHEKNLRERGSGH